MVDYSHLLQTTAKPHDTVYPLGASPLHGPSRDKHIVVILGVGPGLGLAIARIFAAQGYRVAIMSRSKDRLDGWAKEVRHFLTSLINRSVRPVFPRLTSR